MDLLCYDYDKLRNMSDDSLAKYIDRIDNRVKILRFFLNLRKKPEYDLNICYVSDETGWHFEFCDRYDYNFKDCDKCNCLKFIRQESEKLFDIVEEVSKDFKIYILCKNFKLLDITSENCPIDSIQDLLAECKMDENFMELYENLLNPDEWTYIDPSIIPLLEKLKVKRYTFEKLLTEWMKNYSDKYKADEAIRECPHLMELYKNCVKNYSGYIKARSLVSALYKLDEMDEINLVIVNIPDSEKVQFLCQDEFVKSMKKLNGSKNKIFDDIREIICNPESLCYIVSFRINGEDSMHKIPLYNYQTYDDLVDKRKIVECYQRLQEKTEYMVKLYFVNDSIGWHFNFCPNSYKIVRNDKDNTCNCLKYIHDDLDKLFNILDKVSPHFDIGVLGKNFEYFNIALKSNCSFESFEEYKSNEDFKKLYENFWLRIPKNYINPTIMPLLEKLNVCEKTFIKLLEMWMSHSKDIYWIDENVRKYPRLLGFYDKYYKKWCSGCLYTNDLILALKKIDNSSHIYLTITNVTSKESKQIFEGNKRKVIDEILLNNSKKDIWKIEEFKIDDKLYSLSEIPFHMFITFDEVDRKKFSNI